MAPVPARDPADVLAYEVKMLAYTAERVRDLLASPSSTEELDAMTEAFLLHVRNLWEFLVRARSKRQHPDDIVAGDLLPPLDAAAWELTDHGAAMPYLAGKKQRLNVELSHMSRARIGNKATWDVGTIFAELSAEFQRFRALQGSVAVARVRWPSVPFVASLAGTVTYTNHQAASITPTNPART